MNTKSFAATAGLVAAATLTISPQAFAQGKPPKDQPKAAAVSLDAKPNPVVFSGLTTLSGKVTGDKKEGVVVRFEQDVTRPYGDKYSPSSLTATTKANGDYSVAFKPLVNTQLRAIAQTSPPVTSGPRLVLVRMLVGRRVSDSTPRRGSLVRFSGSVYPAHDGKRALIQRQNSKGGFTTVARTSLKDAGTARSRYSRRVRINRDGVYRVKVVGHDDHVNGFSRTRTLRVH